MSGDGGLYLNPVYGLGEQAALPTEAPRLHSVGDTTIECVYAQPGAVIRLPGQAPGAQPGRSEEMQDNPVYVPSGRQGAAVPGTRPPRGVLDGLSVNPVYGYGPGGGGSAGGRWVAGGSRAGIPQQALLLQENSAYADLAGGSQS